MVMRDENVSKSGQLHPGKGKLACDSVSAINHVCHVIRDDYLGRWPIGFPWAWPTARAKKYESGPYVLCAAACRIRRCASQRGGVGQEPPPIDVYHYVDSLPGPNRPVGSLHLKVRYLEGQSSA